MTDTLAVMLDEVEAIVNARLAALKYKGDFAGHPFRGNQYTEGGGSGGGDEGGSGVELFSSAESKKSYADESAKQYGLASHDVEYGGDGYDFEVAGVKCKAAGQYDPRTGKITLYDGAFLDRATVDAVMAHEVTHKKYHAVEKAYRDEVQKILHAPEEHIRMNGDVKPEYSHLYPTYSKIEQFRNYTELRKKDGISEYSKLYWKKEALELYGGPDRAINETLAETARLRFQKQGRSIPKIWRDYSKALDAAYDELK